MKKLVYTPMIVLMAILFAACAPQTMLQRATGAKNNGPQPGHRMSCKGKKTESAGLAASSRPKAQRHYTQKRGPVGPRCWLYRI